MSRTQDRRLLPATPKSPAIVQVAAVVAARRQYLAKLARTIGTAFSVQLPFFKPAVVLSDPDLIKQVFKANPEVVQGIQPNLEVIFGPGSTFGLHGEEHLRRRKLLTPPFNGKRMRAYEPFIEQTTVDEIASWPEGVEFPVFPATSRITLHSILHAVFGAEGNESERLLRVIPAILDKAPLIAIASRFQRDWKWTPWGIYMKYRREFNDVVDVLINNATNADLSTREDVLALMVQARYDDGSAMTRAEIADELFTLVAAGQDTTASALAWALERLSRHPELLDRLVAELDAGGDELLDATVREVLRVRPVIESAGRQVVGETFELGPWQVPQDHLVIANIALTHTNEGVFPDAERFDPDRYLCPHDASGWIPFGGGVRRCIGAAYAQMEMKVVLRTLLREVTILPTAAPDERWRSRGVAMAPHDGGLITVRRRTPEASG